MTKKILLAVFLFLAVFSIGEAYSQTLYFCEGVDSRGYPITESQTFYIPSGGGYFYFLVRLPYAVDCYSVSYDIYEVYSDYTEEYNTTIYHDDLTPSWTWFWKKVTFYRSGYYHVYVRDCNGYNLTSSYVQIYFK